MTSSTQLSPSQLTNGLLTLNLNQSNATSQAQNTTTPDLNIILVGKFDYKAKEAHELDIKKNERLILLDNSKNWWLVRKLDSDQTGYVPSNYIKKEKKSLLQKIMPRKLHNLTNNDSAKQPHLTTKVPSVGTALNLITSFNNKNINEPSAFSCALVKHKYVANKPDELSLNIGARVYVLEKFLDGWWQVAFVDDQQQQIIGLYPSNFLHEENQQQQQQNLISSNSKTGEKNNENSVTAKQQQFSSQTAQQTKTGNKSSSDSDVVGKYDSVSSAERDIEYYRVIYSHLATSIVDEHEHDNDENGELSVERNEIVKLVEDDVDGLDYDKSWIKVFTSQGLVGMIPANCVEPFLDNSGGGGGEGEGGGEFVFVRRPACRGLFANEPWYFGNISRFDTIVLLNKYAQNGDFLLRDSDSGHFSISLKSDNTNNKHFKVFHRNDKFLIGKKMFSSIHELLEHYHQNPIYDQAGEKLYLIKAFEPPSFDSLF